MADIKKQGSLDEAALAGRDKENLSGGGGGTGPAGTADPGGDGRA